MAFLSAVALAGEFWRPAQSAREYALADPYVFPLGYIMLFLTQLLAEAWSEKQRHEMERLRSAPEQRHMPTLFDYAENSRQELEDGE